MSDTPFEDSVAIDTNVFIDLLNPQKNTDRHIDQVLTYLYAQEIALIVDDKGRILGEYENQIRPRIENADEMSFEILILRAWISAPRCVVSLDMKESLMQAISNIMPTDSTDRIFVYVAFKEGKILISNDETHIVVGPVREGSKSPRRQRLLNDTRRIRRRIGSNEADILTSQEAHDRI